MTLLQVKTREADETSPLLPQIPATESATANAISELSFSAIHYDLNREEDPAIGTVSSHAHETESATRVFPVDILAEVIGARHLSLSRTSSAAYGSSTVTADSTGKPASTTSLDTTGTTRNSTSYSCYCVAQFGPKRLHRTKHVTTTDGNPLWTIKESPLFVLSVSVKDILNHKHLVINVWGRRGRFKSSKTADDSHFVGKVRIPAHELLNLCHEQRVEFDLVDDLGRPLFSSSDIVTNTTTTTSTSSIQDNENILQSKIALRFRFASKADIKFATSWNQATTVVGTPQEQQQQQQQQPQQEQPFSHKKRIPCTVLQGCQVLPQEDQPNKAVCVTELEQWEVSGAHFAAAAASHLKLSTISPSKRRQRRGKIRVKPNTPDPDNGQASLYLTPTDLKAMTLEPSREWVQAGNCLNIDKEVSPNTSKEYNNNHSQQFLGRLWVEVLSCHDLPNVDYGTAVGNKTDAFVSLIYGDVMAQTPIIDDELSPHFMPWTQRAFCLGILHPSHILYLAVFGYKRGVFNHVPIGRVEINPLQFQRRQSQCNTEFVLQYDLLPASHVAPSTLQTQPTAGRIRIRLRQEIFDKRALLMAALLPSPPIYLNCRKKASWYVAKYTAYGEHDNLDAFSISVLLAYIDEITKGFLRNGIYSVVDGFNAVVFWKAPIHSSIFLTMGILAMENPQLIPGFIFLGLGNVMLVNNARKRSNPSPWYRCTSYWQYLWILMFGNTAVPPFVESSSMLSWFPSISTTATAATVPTTTMVIEPHEGWDDQSQLQKQWQRRIERDDLFSEKKGQFEKEIERLEQVATIQTVEETNGAAIIISVELINLLGKIQGIVGRLVHLCRLVDNTIRWEESDKAFWVTTLFLGIGVVFLFVPWTFLFLWVGRFTVWILLGPQNYFLHLHWKKHHSDEESKLRQMFEERIFQARCKQEEASKLKAFRHIIFGKFGTAVPGLSWTPRLDRPCHESHAQLMDNKDVVDALENNMKNPCIPGQKLYGVMIPRPFDQWQTNSAESSRTKEQVLSALEQLLQQEDALEQQLSFSHSQHDQDDITTGLEDEGVEVTDVYDVEAGLIRLSPKEDEENSKTKVVGLRRESLKGDWGVEAVDLYENEAAFVRNSWKFLSSKANILSLSHSSSSSDDGEHKVEEGEFAAAVQDAFERRKTFSRAQLPDLQGNGSCTYALDAGDEEGEDGIASTDRVQWIQSQVQELRLLTELEMLSEDEEGPKKKQDSQDVKDMGTISNIPALNTVRTFEADLGDSMAELGFEVEEAKGITNFPALSTVRTFEADSGTIMGELGFETSCAENDKHLPGSR